MVKITERSVYEVITDFLKKEFNAKTLMEVSPGKGYIDVVFSFDTLPYVLEVKLGKQEKKLAEAVAKAWNYAAQLNSRNVIGLVLTEVTPGQEVLIEKIEKLKEVILKTRVEGYVHTEYWEKWVEGLPLESFLRELYQRTIKKEREVDFDSIVKAIREVVNELYDVIRQARSEEIFEEVAKKLDLFVGISDIKDKEKAKSQVNMLAAYLLFNQILFYHLYKIKIKDSYLKDLHPISSLKELKELFSSLLEIDYQPIYSVNILEKIPEKPEIIEKINMVIKNVLVIRTEHVSKDLAGRFFHALLPKEVAKVWAAFYTHPIAAEILASLAIERWDESVIDPACGSGTLLAASYHRKAELYEKEIGRKLTNEERIKLHKKFIEEDITGIDIMPFAAHLTTINLSLQELEQATNVVRVACMDSLELAPKLQLPEFKERGVLLKSLSEEIQHTLFGEKMLIRKVGAVSPSGIGKGFYIKPFDVVIMNPPFSDREKLPKDYREKLSDNSEFGRILGKMCGHQINLWGYFLALADLLLKPGGKIAAVVPINIARGKATEKIRNYLLENYHIKYIIKTTKDLAFSESAAFRDILLIAEKRKPRDDDLTTVVFLKKSIRQLSLDEVKEIISNILLGVKSTEDYEVRELQTSQILRNKSNFMRFLMGKDLRVSLILNAFFEEIMRKSEGLLELFDKRFLKEGFGLRPKGLSEIIMVTRPLHPARIERAFLLLSKESKNGSILVDIKDTRIKIKLNKESLVPSIRSITGIRFLNITSYHDYIILSPYEKIESVQAISKFKGRIKWKEIKDKIRDIGITHIIIPNRVNLSSPNTFIIVPFSKEALTPVGKFFLYKENLPRDKLAILTLYLNSVCFITELLLNRTEATGAYFDIKVADLTNMHKINLTKIKSSDNALLLAIWNKISNVEFPSIIEQLEKRFWARVELDRVILKVLGFSDKEIEEWLPKVYDAVVEELKAMSEVR